MTWRPYVRNLVLACMALFMVTLAFRAETSPVLSTHRATVAGHRTAPRVADRGARADQLVASVAAAFIPPMVVAAGLVAAYEPSASSRHAVARCTRGPPLS